MLSEKLRSTISNSNNKTIFTFVTQVTSAEKLIF